MQTFRLSAVLGTLCLSLACSSGTSSGTTGGSCGGPTDSCSTVSCCEGLTCSAGICLTLGASNTNGAVSASTTTAAAATTGHSATTGTASTTGFSATTGVSGTTGQSISGTTSGVHQTSTTGVATAATGSLGSTGTGFGTTSSSTSGNGTTGSSTSGCSSATLSEFQACTSSATCACGQTCVSDPAFGTTQVCEISCASNTDCSNAASICKDGSCAANTCGARTEGQSCTSLAGAGTCVPQSETSVNGVVVELCLPVGTLADQGACNAATANGGNEDPYYSASLVGGFGTTITLQILTPQPEDPGSFCIQGDACNGLTSTNVAGAVCQPVCATGGLNTCTGGLRCVAADSDDTSWGFCDPCVPSGSDGGLAGECYLASDCCEEACGSAGTCLP